MTQLVDSTSSTLPAATRISGRALFIAGIVGALVEVVLYLWPDQVPETVFSNPFGATGFAVSQTLFFLHHAVLVLGVAALARALWRLSMPAWIGGLVATAGTALWTITELVAIPYAAHPADEVNSGPVGSMFGSAARSPESGRSSSASSRCAARCIASVGRPPASASESLSSSLRG